MPTFKTKSGLLTPYAFACGYIEEQQNGVTGIKVWLSHNSGIGYDVRAYNHLEHERLMWETYETLTAARKAYKDAVRKYVQPLKLH